jgi:hypothetical protein
MRIFLHIVGTVALVHPWIIRLHAIPLALKAVVLGALDVIELALPSNSGEKHMFCKRRISAVAAILLGIGVMLPVEAHAIELTGAWASQTDLCKMVFTKEAKQVVFAEFSDLFGSGFIIDGNRIKGRSTRCTIKSRKQKGDILELAASCASSIMTSSVNFNLKVIDEDNIVRQFPGMDGMTLKYSRCSF